MILVIRATGNTGRRVCNELDRQGVAYRALTRERDRAAARLPRSAQIVEGDFFEPERIRCALDGIDAIFLATPPNRHMVEWQTGVIDMAGQAHVRKIVKLSGPGASPSAAPRLPRLHGMIEKHLKGSGLEYCILRSNPFMQNLLKHAHSVRSDGALYAAVDDGEIGFTDTRDIAHVAVRCLIDDRLSREEIAITGQTAESFYEVARRLTMVIGRRIEYLPVSLEQARAIMRRSGCDQWLSDAMVELFEAYSNNQGRFVSDDFKKLMGAEPCHVAQFIEQNQTAFY